MSKTIQRPLACRNAHCGAMCYPAQAEDMFTIWGGNPNKCPDYERRDDLYRQTELFDKIKKAREEMESKLYKGATSTEFIWRNAGVNMCLEIMDKLIAESEEKK